MSKSEEVSLPDIDQQKVAEIVTRYREHQDLVAQGKVRCSQCNDIVMVNRAIVCTRNNHPLMVTCDDCMKRGLLVLEYLNDRKAFRIQHKPHSEIVLASKMP